MIQTDFAVVYCPGAREMLNPEWIPLDEWAKMVKERLRPPPLWDPDLARHLHDLNSKGRVAFFDWRYLRMRVDALAADLEQYEAEKVILWGNVACYSKMKDLAGRLKDEFIIMGELNGVLGRLMAERLPNCSKWDYPAKDLTPHLNLFDLEGYWRGSWLAHSMDTAMWKRRIPLSFSELKVTPRMAARVVRTAKLKYGFDSVSFLDDATADSVWWLRMFRFLEEDECRFGFTIQTDFEKLDSGLVTKLREHGCRVVDLGDIPLPSLRGAGRRERFQGAVMAIERANVSPALTYMLDGSESMNEICEATEFALAHNLLHRPKITEKYETATEKEWTQMNESFINPFKGFTDTELLGILQLTENGDLKRLREA